jgi:TolB protein
VNRATPIHALALVALAAAARAGAQPTTSAPTPGTGPVAPPVSSLPSQVVVDILGAKGARIPVAIPVTIAPLKPDLQKGTVDPFFTTLNDDLSGSRIFLVSDPALYPKGLRPPHTREEGDQWKASSAQYLLDTRLAEEQAGPSCPALPCVVIEAQLFDLGTLRPILSRSYTGEARAARRIAHTLANDLTRQFTGKPGPFLTKIAFVSDRDEPRVKEVYTMDFDGENQRRLTYSHTLSLAPDWSPDGKRIAYQSYEKDTPGVFLVGRDGTDKARIPLGTQLNASPSFSPDGRTIAFCGSVKGNPEIFTVQLDGSGLKRLTENVAIDSTPRWSPNGRELAFTSNRQGSPQIYMMDLEGANVRRVSLAGNWNDEAAFSPDGGRIGFACRNEGDFQICVMDLQTGRTLQISEGPGAHESPTWSPDGTKVAWEVTRGNSTQIAVANSDGTNMRIVTSAGNNFSPAWIKTLE